MKSILIDDEVNSLKGLQMDLEKYCPEVEIIAQCQGAKEGLLAISKYDPDLVFLDIDMPYINGFEMLEMIPQIGFATIFTTAYDHYAVQAFKISAIDYLLKPINADELKSAVIKAQKALNLGTANHKINILKEQISAVEAGNVKKIALPTMDGLEFINLNDINYCESDSNYTHVYLTDGSKMLISKTLRYLEELLCDYHFFRSHNSYIVNLNYVKRFVKGDGGYLVMTDGTDIKVSRAKRATLVDLF